MPKEKYATPVGADVREPLPAGRLLPGTALEEGGVLGAGALEGVHEGQPQRDINGALAALGKAGHALIDSVGRPGSRRALIGFIYPKSLGGALVHLVQREEV